MGGRLSIWWENKRWRWMRWAWGLKTGVGAAVKAAECLVGAVKVWDPKRPAVDTRVGMGAIGLRERSYMWAGVWGRRGKVERAYRRWGGMELGGDLWCLWMWISLLWSEWGWKRFAGQRIRIMMVGLQGISMTLMVVDYMAGMQRVMMILHENIWRWTNLASRLSMVRPCLLLC